VIDPADWIDPLGLAPCNKADPRKVRFTQNSILSTFKNGESIYDLATALRTGTIAAEVIPAIRTFVKDGVLYSLDNRRLAAFRLANAEVPFVTASAETVTRELGDKLTTKTQGASIFVRDLNRWIR